MNCSLQTISKPRQEKHVHQSPFFPLPQVNKQPDPHHPHPNKPSHPHLSLHLLPNQNIHPPTHHLPPNPPRPLPLLPLPRHQLPPPAPHNLHPPPLDTQLPRPHRLQLNPPLPTLRIRQHHLPRRSAMLPHQPAERPPRRRRVRPRVGTVDPQRLKNLHLRPPAHRRRAHHPPMILPQNRKQLDVQRPARRPKRSPAGKRQRGAHGAGLGLHRHAVVARGEVVLCADEAGGAEVPGEGDGFLRGVDGRAEVDGAGGGGCC